MSKHLPDLVICTQGDIPELPEQCAAIAQAEYQYWRDHCDDREGAMFAMAAAANIFAAITCGMMAPWHPKQETISGE